MDREAVESKTQRFQHKIDQLRPALDERRQVYKQKKARGQRLRKRITAVALGVVGTALLALYTRPAHVPERHETPAPKLVPPAVQQKPAVSDPPAPAEAPAPQPASPTPEAASDPALTVMVAAAEAAEVPPPKPPAQLRIDHSLSCRGVRARECSQPQASFAPHERPHVWTIVLAQSTPQVLTHVWYHEGRKYCEVPLAIEHPRTRTWSTVSLRGPVHLGSWKVEIVTEDGTVLDSVAFSVSA